MVYQVPCGVYSMWCPLFFCIPRRDCPRRGLFLCAGGALTPFAWAHFLPLYARERIPSLCIGNQAYSEGGGEGVQGATAKPPGRARRRETPCWGRKCLFLCCLTCLIFMFFVRQRVSPLRRRPGGFAVAPWTPSRQPPDIQCCDMRLFQNKAIGRGLFF